MVRRTWAKGNKSEGRLLTSSLVKAFHIYLGISGHSEQAPRTLNYICIFFHILCHQTCHRLYPHAYLRPGTSSQHLAEVRASVLHAHRVPGVMNFRAPVCVLSGSVIRLFIYSVLAQLRPHSRIMCSHNSTCHSHQSYSSCHHDIGTSCQRFGRSPRLSQLVSI